MEEVDREIFEDDKRNGEWLNTAEAEARRYADRQAAILRKIDKTHEYSTGVQKVGRHVWAAIIYRR